MLETKDVGTLNLMNGELLEARSGRHLDVIEPASQGPRAGASPAAPRTSTPPSRPLPRRSTSAWRATQASVAEMLDALACCRRERTDSERVAMLEASQTSASPCRSRATRSPVVIKKTICRFLSQVLPAP